MATAGIIQVSLNTGVFLPARPNIAYKVLGCFGGAAKIPFSPTLANIKSSLKMGLHCDTDPNEMDDQLRADIMRIVPGKILEM